ncbi:uncharacterized protein [Leptinotarsa decemlineata]|uniref:uncharacterized protein n=1 Tax=Leptinotarsa decemlineata TaxID=7539 RepID=UPI003D308712
MMKNKKKICILENIVIVPKSLELKKDRDENETNVGVCSQLKELQNSFESIDKRSWVSDEIFYSGDSSYVPSSSEVSSSIRIYYSSDLNMSSTQPTPEKDCNNSEIITKVDQNSNVTTDTKTTDDPICLLDIDKNDETEYDQENQVNSKSNECGTSNKTEYVCLNNITDVETTSTKRKTKLKNFCYYCETDVTNFARHVINNHSTEMDVMKLMSMRNQ